MQDAIKGAVDELRQVRKETRGRLKQIEQAISAVSALNGVRKPVESERRESHHLSLAGRRNLQRAQRARWRKQKRAA